MFREAPLMRAFLGRASIEFLNVRLFRRNVGMMQVKDRIFKAGIAGQCDLYGYTKGGIALEVEIKAANGVLNPEQARWRDWCLAWGVPWLLLRAQASELPVQTVERWCTEFRDFLETLKPHVETLANSRCYESTPTNPATPSARVHFQRARSMFEEPLPANEPKKEPKP